MKRNSSVVMWLLAVGSPMTIVLWFTTFSLKRPFDWTDILFEGIYLVTALAAYLIVRKLDNIVLEGGFAALALSLLIDLLDEFTAEPTLWNSVLPNLLEISSMLTIALGLYFSQRQLEGELVQSERLRVTLEESEGRFRLMADTAPVLIWMAGPDKLYTYLSKSWLNVTGRTLEQELGNGWAEGIHPDDYRRCLDTYASAFDARRPFSIEYRLRRHDGQFRWMLGEGVPRMTPDGVLAGYIGSAIDVTGRRLADAERQRFVALADASSEFIGMFDEEFRPFYINAAGLQLVGLNTLEAACSVRVQDFFFPEDQPFITTELFPQVVRDGHAEIEIRFRHFKTGAAIWMILTAFNLRDAGGRLSGWATVSHDITERKRAEEVLRKSAARLFAFIEYAPTSVAMFDRDMRYIVVSRRWLTDYGLADSSIIGRSHYEVFPEIPERWKEIHRRCLEGTVEKSEEDRFDRMDGRVQWLRWEIRPWCTVNGEIGGIVIFSEDITARKQTEEERRKLETQMQHTQQLESLGVLAGGIAHDFNNLLTVVMGQASLALIQLPEESVANPMLRNIEKAAKRAADLTQQLLAYAGKGKFVIRPLRLDRLVQEMTILLRTVISKKAAMKLHLEPATMEGDTTQLRQVVMNLMTNASDALKGNVGEIRVRTGIRHAEAADLRSPFFPEEHPAGAYAYIEVEDTGCGMSEETVARIFDPFFTTKFTGRGLGLAAMLGIVRGHRGLIKVASTLGRGTVFEVMFPNTAAVADDITPGPKVLPRGQGTILVVDDEPSVRNFAKQVLEYAGYQTRTATDGREALEMLARHRQEFVAVLLDLTMPHMDGLEVLRHLHNLAANIPILIMSGYSEDDVAVRLAGLGVAGIVQKPFHPSDLITRLGQILASRGSEDKPMTGS